MLQLIDVSSGVGRSEEWQDGGRKWLNLASPAPDKLSKSPWESLVERRGLQQRRQQTKETFPGVTDVWENPA